ncbi:MAG: excinuclease ABC subunit UvrC [Candidatus Margulisbacteria bacterium]|nr:excinuclease ABC subunit UvrC [Candidatus Margulisiibacteriota bacterium]
MASLEDKINSLPRKPGVYFFYDKFHTIIYVGKAKSLKTRVQSYFRKQNDLKTAVLLKRLRDIGCQETKSEMDALVLESELIKKHQPRYNLLLKDDKAYPFLKLTVNEEWPRIIMVRRKESDGARYFGPYCGGMARAILSLVRINFPVKLSRAAHGQLIQSIILLLEGKSDAALLKLKSEMLRASEKQDYEWAKILRDRIRQLEKMLEGIHLGQEVPGQKNTALEDLRQALKLEKLPMRIEAFDISNLQGTEMVGSMAVFFGGWPKKADYRRFKVKTVGPLPSDVAAMQEIVYRRYSKTLAQKLPLPDLILIDGGKPQLNAALSALEKAGKLNITVVGLAKKEEDLYLPGRKNPIKLKNDSPALLLLQNIRDEAHRFAVAYHRLRRQKRQFS